MTSGEREPTPFHDVDIRYQWRGAFQNTEVNSLHAEAFCHDLNDVDWWSQVAHHSLGWVCAQDQEGELVGFVNVPWGGGAHAFIQDTMVSKRLRHREIGSELIAIAIRYSRGRGCEWLHVDFEESLSRFYFGSCGFSPTSAGIINLLGGSTYAMDVVVPELEIAQQPFVIFIPVGLASSSPRTSGAG